MTVYEYKIDTGNEEYDHITEVDAVEYILDIDCEENMTPGETIDFLRENRVGAKMHFGDNDERITIVKTEELVYDEFEGDYVPRHEYEERRSEYAPRSVYSPEELLFKGLYSA